MNTDTRPNPRLVCVSNLGTAGILLDHETFESADPMAVRELWAEFGTHFEEKVYGWWEATLPGVHTLRQTRRLIRAVQKCFKKRFDFEYYYEESVEEAA